MLVDDDEDWLMLMQICLKREGFDISVSVNGDDIWQKIEASHPEVILLDIQMNGANGQTFCRLIKKNPSTNHIIVLMYSSSRDIETIAETCGADGYIQKGLTPKEVKDRIMDYRQGSGSFEEHRF